MQAAKLGMAAVIAPSQAPGEGPGAPSTHFCLNPLRLSLAACSRPAPFLKAAPGTGIRSAAEGTSKGAGKGVVPQRWC